MTGTGSSTSLALRLPPKTTRGVTAGADAPYTVFP